VNKLLSGAAVALVGLVSTLAVCVSTISCEPLPPATSAPATTIEASPSPSSVSALVTSNTPSPTPTPAASPAAPTTIAPTDRQPGSVLRVNLQGEPATIDPNRASWLQERTVIAQVFQGLLGYNSDLTLRPDVAIEVPTVDNQGLSADGRTYLFNLKSNATWSDGRKVTAGDFEYSLKRLLSPELRAPYAAFYFAIAGAEAYNAAGDRDTAARQRLRDAVGIKVVDDARLQITLSRPEPAFLQLMALWPAFPVREDVITRFGDRWTEPPNYIGNGPFVLTEWVHQDHLTLRANPRYWGSAPKLAELQLAEIADVNASFVAYRNGRNPIGHREGDHGGPGAGQGSGTQCRAHYFRLSIQRGRTAF
jgi:ABC-type oligopeptide transport system substrate-binding subunit